MKQIDLHLGIRNLAGITITYDEKKLLKNLKSFGEKSLGGFSIEEALEKAYIKGLKTAAASISCALISEEDY